MINIITAINNPILNEELKKEKDVKLVCKDIQYKEGILEILEINNYFNKNNEINKEKYNEENKIKLNENNYIIIDSKLPGEIALDNLIEKILEKNKNIKIIITIKEENKIKLNINKINNKKIIKIFYKNIINLEQLKIKNRNSEIKSSEEKNKIYNNGKIISIIGDRKVGKSMTILNIINLLQSKNCKILYIDLNADSPYVFEKYILHKVESLRKKFKNYTNKKVKYCDKKFLMKYNKILIIEKLIKKINENLYYLKFNKLINYKIIKKLKNNYDYIFIEINLNKNIKNKIKKIINNEKNILIINPNLIEIKNNKKIIEKNKLNNFKIIINNYNKFSINKEIIKNIFNKNKIIGKIKHFEEYEDLINQNFKNYKNKFNLFNKEFKKIIDKIII